MYKQIILSKILDYLKKANYPFKKTGNIVMMECPFCEGDSKCVSIIPNTAIMNCLKCSTKFDLIALVKKFENKEGSDEDILEYIKDLLGLDIKTKKDADKITSILDRYEKESFCLLPCAIKDKNPIQEGWTKKENRNKEEWAGWIANGNSIGLRTGEVSGITVIDIDLLTKAEKIILVKKESSQEEKDKINAKRIIPEEIKAIMGETWVQQTQGGFHLIYQYEDIPKCRIRLDGYDIDLENDGGQIIVEPAPEIAVKEEYEDANGTKRKRIAGYASRKFINNNPIAKMPEALKKFILEKAPKKSDNGDLSLADQANNSSATIVKIDALDDGDGRNMFFTSFAGYLSKKMNPDQVEYALHGLNPRICKTKLDGGEIKAMVRSIQQYGDSYADKMEQEILEYIHNAKIASKPDIELAVMNERVKGETKKKLDLTMVKLIKDGKITQEGRQYKIKNNMDWTDVITNVGIPVNFKVPYFYDYANFNWGDLILVGGLTKSGKTVLSMNIIKRIVDQGIKPYYIYSESGARYQKTALKLGLSDGSFFRPPTIMDDIEDIEFKSNSIVIWDWIDPPNFAETNKLFKAISRKAEESQAFLICFVQLKETNKTNGESEPNWFAPNMIKQRPALAVKFLYDSEDGIHGKFKLDEIRDSKVKGKKFIIPTVYNWQTSELNRADELEKDNKNG